MNSVFTIELPEDIKASLDKTAVEDGISENAVAVRAIEDYLFLRRFRSLRDKMMTETGKTYTDEEVFELVS